MPVFTTHLLRFLLFGSLFLLSWTMAQGQSPWVRSKAGFFVQAAGQIIPAYTQLYNHPGQSIDLQRAVRERCLQFYGEYGLNRRTTAVITLPFVSNRRGNINPGAPINVPSAPPGTLTGLGNVQLALRHQIGYGRIAFTGTLRIGLPATKNQAPTGLRTGFDALTIAPILSTGIGFRKAYCFIYSGYGWRSNHYSAFLQSGLEAGYHLGRFWLIGFTEYNGSLSNGSQALPAQDVLTGLYVNDQQWGAVGVKTLVAVHRFWGLSASATGAAWGQYVPEKPAFSVGAYFKWD